MKKSLIALAAALSALPAPMAAETAPVAVKWIMGENFATPRQYSSQFVVTNVTDSTLHGNWGLYYNIFPNEVTVEAGSPAAVKEIIPNYYVLRPTSNYVPLAPGDSMVINMMMHGTFTSRSFAPDGGHFAFDGKMSDPIPVAIAMQPLTHPSQWSLPGQFADYPDGTYVYNLNESVNPAGAKFNGSDYDIFPTPKSIDLTGGSVTLTDAVTIEAAQGTSLAASYLREKLAAAGINEGHSDILIKLSLMPAGNTNSPEYYELAVNADGTIDIAGASPEGLLNGVKTLVAVIETKWALTDKVLPCVKISDYPDLAYRGVMIDIARNFTRCDDLKRMIDLLASYKINRFQFHFCDDEAWRLEIPGLPELTQVGSRKGLTFNETDFLVQTYRGTGNPYDTTGTANGYYTRRQFIDLLKYAAARGVKVIPEIETPGHSRAAIVSMKHRHAHYAAMGNLSEAERYLLWDDRDTSAYTSAQGFHDNILCIGQEGTYRFLEKVIDELALMYEESGLRLDMLHIGGDEVPAGAWEGSPVVHEMMRQQGYTTINEAREYFIDRLTAYLDGKGIKATGWQEVALHHSTEYDARVARRFGGVNAWSTVGSSNVVTYTLANAGYPVILSGVNNFYFDMVYSRHQDEDGLSWGGATDEFTSWQAQPFDIYRTRFTDYNGRPIDLARAAEGRPRLERPENIVGVQGQVFAETVRDFNMVQAFVFPKLFGLAERGWNARPEWGGQYKNLSPFYAARSQYNLKVGLREMPRIFNKGVNFRIGQPGLKVENGMLTANTRYPGMTVRYTLDGSTPTRHSPQWTAPVPVGNASVVKARAYYLGKESSATFLFLNE